MKNNFSKQWDAGGGSRSIIQGLNLFTSRNLFKSLKSITILMLLALGSSSLWATDFTLSSANPVTKDGITVSFGAGTNTSNSPTWYDAGLRLYASNTVTISSSSDITAITFNWEKQGSKTFASASASTGTYSHPSSAGAGTWTGSAKSITFTLGGTGQLQLNTLSVTAGSSYTISATVNNDSYGEVSVSGNTIPNTGYCVDTSNPYTVTSGTADVTYNDDNTFTVETEADCSVRVNLKAQEVYTVTFFNNNTQLKQVQVYEGEAIGKSNLPSTPTAWHATSTEFAGWTTQFIKGNTQTTINDNQFVDSYTKVTGNMTVYALWASTDATTSTFDASNTSNLTESDDYYEFSENTTGVILGGYDIFTDKGSYFRAEEGDNEDVAIYVQSPNKVIKQVVFTIDGTVSSYGIASVTDGSLSSTSSSPQTVSNVRTNYMEAYPNGSTIDLKKVVVTTYTNYITNSITYTDLFSELKIPFFLPYFMSFF